jgi:hypothetical protein
MNSKHNVAERSAKLIYRDLIRMIKKTLPDFRHKATLSMLRREFDKNRSVTNPKEIEDLKLSAGKAIADTYVYKVKEELLQKKKNKEVNIHKEDIKI